MAAKKTTSAAKAESPKPVSTTAVRNTAIPPTKSMTKKEVTRDMIAKRAFEIFKSGKGGSEVENWLRAERELRA